MAFFSFIYKYGLWISIPAFALSVFLLIMFITGVVRTSRQARLFSVPVVERQAIEFADAGDVVLCTEGPILSRRFSGLKYEIADGDGRAVSSRPVILRARTSGFSTARMESRIYHVEHPGRYDFRIFGLADEKPLDSSHSIVFTRRHLMYRILYVIGIVLASLVTVGSIVLFFLRLLNVK